jgi:hypothetical protein
MFCHIYYYLVKMCPYCEPGIAFFCRFRPNGYDPIGFQGGDTKTE